MRRVSADRADASYVFVHQRLLFDSFCSCSYKITSLKGIYTVLRVQTGGTVRASALGLSDLRRDNRVDTHSAHNRIVNYAIPPFVHNRDEAFDVTRRFLEATLLENPLSREWLGPCSLTAFSQAGHAPELITPVISTRLILDKPILELLAGVRNVSLLIIVMELFVHYGNEEG
ncbi:hypothetical protein EVAR_24744_1 [Eumeta japonica]|uniref:Uncharacterized protein n=1 Tax=Eumeta variegata TaxID=151549 RepID=A0A4C1VD18_EUMVA|nr:hypothetical protein EVAR_24744_1 [Eumeta japonica]